MFKPFFRGGFKGGPGGWRHVYGLIVATPLQGGGENSQGDGENFRIASLAICHPPDQNAETASAFFVYLYAFLLFLSAILFLDTELYNF